MKKICRACGREFEVEKKRGRPPSKCPECRERKKQRFCPFCGRDISDRPPQSKYCLRCAEERTRELNRYRAVHYKARKALINLKLFLRIQKQAQSCGFGHSAYNPPQAYLSYDLVRKLRDSGALAEVGIHLTAMDIRILLFWDGYLPKKRVRHPFQNKISDYTRFVENEIEKPLLEYLKKQRIQREFEREQKVLRMEA